MNKIKDILFGSLGVLGLILWYIISAVVLFAPLIFLDFSFWIDVLIILAILSLPIIGSIIELIVWVWSFIVVVSEPIDGWSVVYFVAFAFYFFTTILPCAINIIVYLFGNLSNNRKNDNF